MVKMSVGAGTDSNANPGIMRRSGPAVFPPVMTRAPVLSGTGRVGSPLRVDAGGWAGSPTPVLTLRWRRDDGDVPGAAGTEYVPGPADDMAELRCLVTASNAAGSAQALTEALRVTREPPVAAGGLPDAVFDQGGGVRPIGAARDFTGENLTFGVTGAGASIDPATGTVGIDTAAPVSGGTVTVTATNSGGSASSAFRVTVEAVDPGPDIAPMEPPRPVEGSLRSTRLALTLAAAPDTGGAVITGYDLRFAQNPTSAPEPVEGEDEPTYAILSGVGPDVRLMDLAPGASVRVQSRVVTEAGPGPWSAPAVVALPAADALTFRDTFTTGGNGAAVNAPGRTPDIGPAWRPFPGGGATLNLIQPEGRATHGGSSVSLSPRAAKVMVFDGGFWAGTSGTLDVDFMIGAGPGERANLILSSVDGSAYVRVLMRNQAADTGRFQIWIRSATRDGPVVEKMDGPTPTLATNSVNTLRMVRDGSTLRFSINGIDEIAIADVAGLPSGTLWGVGGDSSNGNPAWLDDVRFSDMPAVPAAPPGQPFGPVVLQTGRSGATLTDEG